MMRVLSERLRMVAFERLYGMLVHGGRGLRSG